MAASPRYLKKRINGWYVQVAVPREYQGILRRKTVTRSLKTSDAVEAQKRKHAVIAAIFSEIRQSAAVAPEAPALRTPEDLLRAALQEREAVAAGDQHPDHADAAVDAAVEDYLDQQAAIHGRDAEGQPRVTPDAEAAVRRAYGALRGRADLSLSHNVTGYLQELERNLAAQTREEKRRSLSAFLAWFGGERECGEVTRKVAGTYVTEVINKRPRKRATRREGPLSAVTLGKEIGDLRTFFKWLEGRGRIDANPFERMASTVKDSTRGRAAARRPWKATELSTVLRSLKPEDPLWSLTALAAYTGMRREEVATLQVESIDKNVLLVREGKTAAAPRRVPIHSAIAPLVKHLAKTTTDGFLIPGLLRGGPDQKRGQLLGKRFGQAILRMGIDDPQLNFHAFRNTVITQMEEEGVPVSTISLVVGHERQGITLGVYSGGVSDKVTRAAIQKIGYGKLDAFVAETGAAVVVKASAKARKKASN